MPVLKACTTMGTENRNPWAKKVETHCWISIQICPGFPGKKGRKRWEGKGRELE